MSRRGIGILIVIVLLLAAGAAFAMAKCRSDNCYFFGWQRVTTTTTTVTSFEQCAALGYPVAASYPRTCQAGTVVFTETVAPAQSVNIHVASPLPGMTVQSPLTVRGEARGWYFEASFPVRLLDGNGMQIATGIAQAQGSWMTSDFIPFVAKLTFANPGTANGTLMLMKDNPSGLPQNEESVSIPVRFPTMSGPSAFGTPGSVIIVSATTGTLRGTMTIGPICPVERQDQPCTPTREMYAAHTVYVYRADRTTLVATLTPDANGNFSAVLSPGIYLVTVQQISGVGRVSGAPAEVTIRAGAFTDIAIDIDTGIR